MARASSLRIGLLRTGLLPVSRKLVGHWLFLLMLTSLLSNNAVRAESRGISVVPTTSVGIGSVWGVFVGVSNYYDKSLNLTYADRDALALHGFFTQQFANKIPSDHFKILTNEQATRGHILRALAEVLGRAQPEDLVLLSFALHGIPDTTGQDLYFLAFDSDSNHPEDRGLSQEDLYKAIRRSKARKIVLFLDACHAGAFGSSPTLLASRSANTTEINRMLLALGQVQDGIAVFSSSSAAERSQEDSKFCEGHGAFTCALLVGLQGAADTDGNGLVQIRELYDYTYREVTRLTAGQQHPAIEGRYDNGLPIASSGLSDGSGTPTAAGSSPMIEELARLKQRLVELESEKNDGAREGMSKLKKDLELLKTQPTPLRPEPNQIAKAPTYGTAGQPNIEILGLDGAPMVLVPAGEFRMGSSEGKADERPVHMVDLDAFYMDKYEVTVSLYAKFLKATRHDTPPNWTLMNQMYHQNRPVTFVDWDDANSYCHWAGKRLPTEAEWEKAARGTDGRLYPWGDEAPDKLRARWPFVGEEIECHTGCLRKPPWEDFSWLSLVGSLELGKSPYGIFDLAGNVWEWVSDWYDEAYYEASPSGNPKGPERGTYKILRGGKYHGAQHSAYVKSMSKEDLQSSSRDYVKKSYRNYRSGFRCAKTP